MSDDTTDADDSVLTASGGFWDYAYMRGDLVREPWSELDLGIVRETPPLATNNFAVFAEQWEGIHGDWLFSDGGTLDLEVIRDSGCRCRWVVTRRLHRMWSWLRWGGWRR